MKIGDTVIIYCIESGCSSGTKLSYSTKIESRDTKLYSIKVKIIGVNNTTNIKEKQFIVDVNSVVINGYKFTYYNEAGNWGKTEFDIKDEFSQHNCINYYQSQKGSYWDECCQNCKK